MLHHLPTEIRTAILIETRDAISAISVECLSLLVSSPISAALLSKSSIDEFPASKSLTLSPFLPLNRLINADHIALHWLIHFRRHLVEYKLWDVSKCFAERGNVSALRILVENGFEISGDLLFKYAIQGHHRDVISYLTELGFDGFQDGCFWLEKNHDNNIENVQLAIDLFGDRIITDSFLLKACNNAKSRAVAKYLLGIKNDWGCLSKCLDLVAFHSDVELVKMVLGAISDEAVSSLVVTIALDNRDFGMVRVLVEGGVDCDPMLLVEYGEVDLVELLAQRAFGRMGAGGLNLKLDEVYQEYWKRAIDKARLAKGFVEASISGDLEKVKDLGSVTSSFLEKLLLSAIEAGHKEIAHYLSDRLFETDQHRLFDFANVKNNIDIFAGLRIAGEGAANFAAEKGRIDVLRALHAHQPSSITVKSLYYGINSLETTRFLVEDVGLMCTPEVIARAATNKDVLVYLHERFSIPYDQGPRMKAGLIANLGLKAPEEGLDILKYLHRDMGLECDSNVLARTSRCSLEMFLYAFEHRTGDITEEVWKNAVVGGHCDRVVFLMEKFGERTIPADWLNEVLFSSSSGVGLDMLKFLAARNLTQFTDSTLRVAATCGDLGCVRYLHSEFGLGFTGVIPQTCLKFPSMIRYLVDVFGLTLDTKTLPSAAAIGHISKKDAVLLVDSFVPFSPKLLFNQNLFKADFGTLDNLAMMVEREVIDVHAAVREAACHRKLGAVKFLFGVGGCGPDALEAAAEVGCLEVVRFLHENGVEWTVKAVEKAAKGGCVEVVYYLLSSVRKEKVSLETESTIWTGLGQRMVEAYEQYEPKP
ncbi:hypothetical protein HDU97_006520 [Phlyctochytrium planicorne]|nr:hypothetical protein HDU97_006520 [Phlyctochytrium planicorne]